MKVLRQIFLFYGVLVGVVSPGQSIDAGNDTIICLGGTASLSAQVAGASYGTSSYSFQVVPYNPMPFSGGTQIDGDFQGCVALGHDDCWAGPYNIGFNFCFFNEYYTQMWVGSNGWIGFSDPSGHSWTTYTSAPIPSTDPLVPKNCIMAPWEDWFPSLVAPNVFYYLSGTAPNRKLVVYWKDCPMFTCPLTLGTFQIVINEQNSVIENNIVTKPVCNLHSATQGVHNIDGTLAYTASGRNSTVWAAANESTRFVPSGIKWYTGGYPGGTLLGLGPSLNVSPITTTTYTAVLETCGGDIVTDTVTVFMVDASFSYSQGSYCQKGPDPLPVVAQPGGTFTAAPAGLVFISQGSGLIDLAASAAGTYVVTYTITNNSCTVFSQWQVIILETPDPPTPVNNPVFRCGPGQVSVEVIQNPGEIITWYDAPVGGNLLPYVGASISVMIGAVTHFYPQATNAGTTCTNLTRGDITAIVNPIPAVNNPVLLFNRCSGESTNILLSSTVPGTDFSWTATATSGSLTGYSNGSGLAIVQIIQNSGTGTDTVLYTVTPEAAGCSGTPVIFTVAVFPQPVLMNNPPDTAICSGEPTGVTLQSNIAGTLFTWTSSGSSGNVTGFFNQIIPTNILNQTLTNSGDDTELVTYQVTPTANGCNGIVWTYIVTVYPVPDVSNSPMLKEICNNNNTDIDLTSNISGTLFTWTAIGSSANITGYTDNTIPSANIGNDLINLGNINETVTYHITPHANGCDGIEVDYIVTVVPSPFLTNNPQRQPQCNNLNTNIVLESNVVGTVFSWTCTHISGNISGYSNSTVPGTVISQLLVNSSFVTDSVIYHLTPENSGCPGSVTDYTVVVFPVPDLYFNPTEQTVCEGDISNIQNLSHVTGTTFSWITTPSSPDLSGYSDGTGDLIAQLVDNNGSTIEWVTYQVTPTANGCPPGTTLPVILTVNPRPVASSVPPRETICNGQVTNLSLQSDVTGATMAWRAFSSSPDITGFSDGTGFTIAHTLVNSGYNIDSVTYRIAATANGCLGDSTDINVVVFPVADVIFTPTSQDLCSGEVTDLTLQSNVFNTTYSWTATGSSLNVTGQADGSGDLIQQTLVNSGNNIEWVTYQVTPAANGCNGVVTDFTVTVYPVPDLFFVPEGETICEGETSDLSLQSHVNGTTFEWTATASSANLSGYSGGSGDLIAQSIDNAGTTIESVTYLVEPAANGCPPGVALPVVLTVVPFPLISNDTTRFQLCSTATTSISLQTDIPGSTFAWRAFGTSSNLSGYSNGNGENISQSLTNIGYTSETVTYRAAATSNSCPGDSIDFVVTVFPVPDIIFVPDGQSLCSGQTTGLNLQSQVAGTMFTWTAAGSHPNVTGYSSGSGNSIQQALINQGYLVPWVTYQVTPSVNGCIGPQDSAVVTVNPLPVVSLMPCFDTLTTTNAQPILLKGGIPHGGVYSGTGVDQGTGSFNPGMAGPGTHLITYTYTNEFTCSDSSHHSVIIYQMPNFNCGTMLTDIRDNRTYPTVTINGQCWMAADLNFGDSIPSSQIQRDNCLNEKYCYDDNPINCNTYGGLYQWDEVMRYSDNSEIQGLCPPGWHIPSETEWNTLFNFYISGAYAGDALKSGGSSGFNAVTSGIRFHNSIWKFPVNDTTLQSKLFWSSTMHGHQRAWAHGINKVVSDLDFTHSVSFHPGLRTNAFALRCIRN